MPLITDTTTTIISLDVAEATRLITALQRAKQNALADAHDYGHEGVEARIELTAHAVSGRIEITTLESWIAAFEVTSIETDGE